MSRKTQNHYFCLFLITAFFCIQLLFMFFVLSGYYLCEQWFSVAANNSGDTFLMYVILKLDYIKILQPTGSCFSTNVLGK